MNYLEPYAMKKQCGDCAFDPVSPAGKCEVTVLTAQLCIESGEPFYCHRPKDGIIVARTDDRGEPVLCRGFVEAFEARGPQADWKAAIADECLRILEDAQAGNVISNDEATSRVLAAVKRTSEIED